MKKIPILAVSPPIRGEITEEDMKEAVPAPYLHDDIFGENTGEPYYDVRSFIEELHLTFKARETPNYFARNSDGDTEVYNENQELVAVCRQIDDKFPWTTQDMKEAVPFPYRSDFKLMTTDDDSRAVSSTEYTMEPVTDRSALPYRAIGKIFAKFSSDKDWKFVATGWVDSANTIITAAHVVYDRRTRRWVDSLIFIPAYNNGEKPYGFWSVDRVAVPGTFRRNLPAADEFDIAVVHLKKGGNQNEDVGSTVGFLSFTYNAEVHTKVIRHIGYPNDSEKGEVMYRVDGRFTRWLTRFMYGKRTCPGMRGGSSGGPWLLPNDTVCGLESWSDLECPTESFSPYLEQAIEDFMDSAHRTRYQLVVE